MTTVSKTAAALPLIGKWFQAALNFLESPCGVLVQQTRDEGLVRQAFGESPLLNRLQVLARQPDVQTPVLPKRGLRVTGVASAFALATLGGCPLAALDGI